METTALEQVSTPTEPTLHQYVEVSGDLLAKPDALAEIIEVNRGSGIVIFCNTPSDADLIEALLRKRGVTSRKLIGHVPPARVSKSVAEVRSGEAAALIVTDVSGQSLDLGQFEVSINYAMHNDPEVYLQRAGQMGGGAPKRVISIIGPLDITHFHYIKKVGGLEFSQLEPPSQEKIAGARVDALRKQAEAKKDSFDDRIKNVADLVLKDSDSKTIVSLLVQLAFEAPAAPTQSYDRDDEDDSPRGDRGDRGDRRGRGRGRNDRGGDRDEGGYEGQPRERGERHHRERGERPDRGPTKKEARLYVGIGTKMGFNEEALKKILAENCPEAAANLHRFSGRTGYSFFDVDEGMSDLVATKLSEVEWKGEKLFIKEAIKIPVLRPREAEEAAPTETDGDNSESHDSSDDHSDDDNGSDSMN